MAKCRVFGIDHGLKTVVENGLYMKTMIGETMSVAVIKFVEQEGTNLPAKAHDHGEEASLQVLGSCSIFEVRPDTPDVERTLAQGDAMIIPAGLSHYGKNRYGAEGVSMRLNVVSPARAEYAAQDDTPYYPLANRS
ncbi:cupin domain-containing protein [Paraburkholderia acidisoli]|uniref:Cupin n=1 Tax=Paraburkholderia acidisoli TaxID=2571748 RepID=A0A7Z2JGL4_9BURK|nr:cupin domain-containing protein [Paraburkholderia acidisoli]QGZ64747.1 cupin [Paraburkholderia acidisoli]